MLILGLASLLQITFLPGFLVMVLTRTNFGIIRTTLISFSLSLFLNFYFVVGLVFMKSYTKSSLYVVFTIELFLLFYLIRNFLNQPLRTMAVSIGVKYHELNQHIGKRCFKTEYILVIASLLTLAFFISNYFLGIGTIFDHGDDIVSWNRWAVDWYNGDFPYLTWNYPQLLPANWSITYAFLNESKLQFFAKSLARIFPLFVLLAFYDLWIRKHDLSYLFAIPVTALLCFVFTGSTMNKGYADIPVAFMSFMSIYILLITEAENSISTKNKNMIIGSICCAGGALTKQAGLYLLAVYPLFCYLLVIQKFKHIGIIKKIIKTISLYLLLTIFTAPWYTYTALKIVAGTNDSEIRNVTHDIYIGKSILQRFMDLYNNILSNLGLGMDTLSTRHEMGTVFFISVIFLAICIVVIISYFMLLSTHNKLCRYLLTLIVAPYFCIWIYFFSYDFRNLTLIFPIVGMVIGHGVYYKLRTLENV